MNIENIWKEKEERRNNFFKILGENILYDYLYKDKKITKELYNDFKELKKGECL